MFLSAWLKSNIKIITVKNEGSLLIMKNRRMRLMAIFAAGVLSVTSMGGIVTAHAEETLSVPAEEAGAGAVQMDGKDAQAAEDGSVAASEGLIAGRNLYFLICFIFYKGGQIR